MFAPFMMNAWAVATIVAVVAGVVGFFVVLRGAAFVADAVPQGGSNQLAMIDDGVARAEVTIGIVQ